MTAIRAPPRPPQIPAALSPPTHSEDSSPLSLRRSRPPSGRFSNRAIRIAMAFSVVSGLTLLGQGLALHAAARSHTLCSPPYAAEVPGVPLTTR